ncbi:hypothetical protein SGFS_013340 [Streptomyces graminofaciens]|uniref:Uncharacterized protein n=1 Tax=Streptomyces graminofaciens TaxID=68212 RepID=A0ABN5V9R9_9ACTN|nr:hypothetical protein [Streptomyces graminofaciens]BBC30040.1 hypothetical protein SGFS_013340 [Streptomyces graminofaciens]
MTQPPTIAQLRNLTDRAEAGLTPDEQARLRAGVDRLEQAEAAIDRVRAARDRIAHAPAYVDAIWCLDQLDAALAEQPAAHNDGPTVREAAADDRRWPLQKTGE